MDIIAGVSATSEDKKRWWNSLTQEEKDVIRKKLDDLPPMTREEAKRLGIIK